VSLVLEIGVQSLILAFKVWLLNFWLKIPYTERKICDHNKYIYLKSAFTENKTIILQLTYQLLVPIYTRIGDWLMSSQNLHSTNSRVANKNLFCCRYAIFLDFPLHNTRTNVPLRPWCRAANYNGNATTSSSFGLQLVQLIQIMESAISAEAILRRLTHTLAQCIEIPVPSAITHTDVPLYITIITVVVTEVLS